MGTLFNQQPRSTLSTEDDEIIMWCEWVDEQAKELNWEVKDVLKAFEIHERERTNNLLVRDGDAKDEQLAGFGEILQNLVNVLDEHNTRL